MTRGGVAGRRHRALALLLGTLGLAVVVALAFYLDLGRAYLWDPGESRYAEVVREMRLTGDWLVPTLNFQHYYDKPPGFFWLVGAAFDLLGTSEMAARLPAAIAATLTIAATVVFGWRRVGPAAALAAGAILATAIEFVVLGRSVRMDSLLTLTVSGAIFYGYALLQGTGAGGEPGRRAPTWPLFVLMAAGLLVKGPIALVLPVLVLGALTIVSGEYGRLKRLRPGPGALAAVALVATWYVPVTLRAPEYLWTFLWRHNVGRFVAAASGEGHARPFWFYLWVLPVAFLPWTLFLPGAVRRALRHGRRGDDLALLLLLWPLVVVVFFSLSRGKLATYVLPAFPPLALLVGAYLARALRAAEATGRRALQAPGIVWAWSMLAGIPAVTIGVAARYPTHSLGAASALLLAPFPLALLAAARRGHWRAVPAIVFVGALATQALFYRAGVPIVNELSSLHDAADLAHQLPAAAQIFAYKTRGHSFTFYDGRVVTRVRSPEAAAAALATHEPTALLTKTKQLAKIQRHLAEPVCIWWQNAAGRVLIVNQPAPQSAHGGALVPTVPSARANVTPPPPC